MKNLVLVSLILIAIPVFSQVGANRSALLGEVTNADDCSPELQAFNEKIMAFGRIVAVSDAFAECLDSKVRSLYRKCNDDPFYDETIEIQIQKVLAIARSLNDVHINCTGGNPGGNASAGILHYGLEGNETFSWSGWFTSVYNQFDRRLCSEAEKSDPDGNNCRFDEYPWPYSQGAEIAWHEVMHQQGYTHGANEQASAIVNCGYSGDATWDFQVNTMPYIVGSCIASVINQSANNCDIDNCPGTNQLKIVESNGGTSCKCINDPGKKGLGIITLQGNKLTDAAIKPIDTWIGGWRLGNDNNIATSGDYNGDGKEDFIITSPWGIGIHSYYNYAWRPLVVKQNGTGFGGWNFQSNDNNIIGSGDFDGNGKDDIVISSNWGLGILTLNGNTLSALVVKQNGTSFGEWRFNSTSDRIQGVGDFDGDGRDELLVTSDWGIGILGLSGESLNSEVIKPNGSSFGGWNFQSTDNVIELIDDFDGDNADEILVTSGWGMGIINQEGSNLTALTVTPNNSSLGGWSLDTQRNSFSGTGDIDGNGTSDIVLTSTWGIGILSLSGGSLSAQIIQPNGANFGQWVYDTGNNEIVGLADFDNNGGDELIISSPWGIGLLTKRSSGLSSIDLIKYGDLAGSWIVERADEMPFIGAFNGPDGASILVQKKEP